VNGVGIDFGIEDILESWRGNTKPDSEMIKAAQGVEQFLLRRH
jgi:hypothetical protein